jgi:hypothetical protein
MPGEAGAAGQQRQRHRLLEGEALDVAPSGAILHAIPSYPPSVELGRGLVRPGSEQRRVAALAAHYAGVAPTQPDLSAGTPEPDLSRVNAWVLDRRQGRR